ncbi:hypothetical protein ACEQ8H_004807 [Pleosporales sp. CAS-2024a]
MFGSIIVPLDVYPSSGAWDPMFDICAPSTFARGSCSTKTDQNRAASYPQVQLTAIINVSDGPGDGALPNSAYAKDITTLNGFENIRTVGYVATTWCNRDLNSVLDDGVAYSFWGEYEDSLAVDGIFVDETPTQYSPDSDSYLQAIAQAIHDSDGLKKGYIVHNSGALPDPLFFEEANSQDGDNLRPDLTIVFENSFAYWSTQSSMLADVTSTYNRDKIAVVLHSVPDLGTLGIITTLSEVLAVGHSMWLTGSTNYTNLDALFPVVLECLVALLS